MKNEAPDNSDLAKLAELIDGIEVAMLTTRSADGSMVSRPLETLKLDSNGELIFFTGAKSHKVAELTDDASVNLAYADIAHRRFVSVRGRARMDRDEETINELWSPAQKIFFPAGKNDPNLMVLRIRVRDASWWESSDTFIGRALDFARGMMDESSEELGQQGHLDG